MNLILKPAILYICKECEGHGRFILGDKSTSAEFCSREGAYGELRKLTSEELVTKEEVTFLENEVYESPLVKLDSDASLEDHIFCKAVNEGIFLGNWIDEDPPGEEELPVM